MSKLIEELKGEMTNNVKVVNGPLSSKEDFDKDRAEHSISYLTRNTYRVSAEIGYEFACSPEEYPYAFRSVQRKLAWDIYGDFTEDLVHLEREMIATGFFINKEIRDRFHSIWKRIHASV